MAPSSNLSTQQLETNPCVGAYMPLGTSSTVTTKLKASCGVLAPAAMFCSGKLHSLQRTSARSFTSHLGRNTFSLPQCLPLLPSQHLQLHQFQRKSLHLPLVNRLMVFFSLLPFTNLSHAAHIISHVLQFKTSRLTMALPQNSAKPGSPQGRGVPDHPGGDSRLKPCCADR